MISRVRQYIRDRVNESTQGLKEWTDNFNFENIPKNRFNKSYHINIDVINSFQLDDQSLRDESNISLRIFFLSPKDNQSYVDNALDIAHEIRLRLIDPLKIRKDEHIIEVICNSITPEFFLNNDNSIIINLNLSMTSVYKSCL